SRSPFMAYGDFTLKDVVTKFGLTTVERVDLFEAVPEVQPSERLVGLLHDFRPIALAIHTEKARSEYLTAPVLGELRLALHPAISLFSGNEFPVDPARGLNGYCDFILSRGREQQYITAPVMVVVEAKNDNLKNGLGQCAAGMVAARVFNEREGSPVQAIHGAVTTGMNWRFLRLIGDNLFLDGQEYHLNELPKLLGILHHIMREPAVPAAA
ncbi:MAG TPA: hypothetical protein VH092_23035, partial [Urbifossiella sp.]|nr:hypothetical protein [Urbifossiella sp.]